METASMGIASSGSLIFGNPIILEDGTTAYAAMNAPSPGVETHFTAAIAASSDGRCQDVLETSPPPEKAGLITGIEFGVDGDTLPTSPLKIDLSFEMSSNGSPTSTDFERQSRKKRRSRSSSSSADARTICAICYHETKSSGAMTLHLRTHSNERPFVCDFDECTKAFKTSTDFARHRRTHTGERPYACDFDGCGLGFKTSAQRAVHARRHTGERPYACDFQGCRKTFASSANLMDHSGVHSRDYRPFACRFEGCEKRYADYSSLHKHRAKHGVAKRYPCELCGKTYGQISTLRHHERTKHDRKGLESGENGLAERTTTSSSSGSRKARDGDVEAMAQERRDVETIAGRGRVSVVKMEQTPVSDLTCLSLML